MIAEVRKLSGFEIMVVIHHVFAGKQGLLSWAVGILMVLSLPATAGAGDAPGNIFSHEKDRSTISVSFKQFSLDEMARSLEDRRKKARAAHYSFMVFPWDEEWWISFARITSTGSNDLGSISYGFFRSLSSIVPVKEPKVYDVLLANSNRTLLIIYGDSLNVRCGAYSPTPDGGMMKLIDGTKQEVPYKERSRSEVIRSAFFDEGSGENRIAYLILASGETNTVTWNQKDGWTKWAKINNSNRQMK